MLLAWLRGGDQCEVAGLVRVGRDQSKRAETGLRGRRPIRKVGPEREQEHQHERAETSIRGRGQHKWAETSSRGRRPVRGGGDWYEEAETRGRGGLLA